MQPDSDCLLVGAGLVGSIAALALSELGLRVTVLEQRAQLSANPGREVRALVLSAASVRILERYALWPRLSKVACAVREIRVSDHGGFGTVTLHADEIGLDALGWACPADQLLQVFNAALLERPNIDVHWSSRFDGAHSVAGGMSVAAQSGGRTREFVTRLLLGADGSDSAVRRARAIEVERLDYGQVAIVAGVNALGAVPLTAFEHFTRSGPLAFLPAGGARYVSVQCLAAEEAEAALLLDDAAYLGMLERRLGGRLGRFEQLGPRRKHALVRQCARTLHAPRTVILGNAANTVHPNAAQGLNLGLRDVAALGAVLAGSDDVGAAAVLERYQAARRRDHRLTGAFTDVLAQAFRSRLGAVACARRAAMLLTAHVAPLRRRLLLDASGLARLVDAPRAA